MSGLLVAVFGAMYAWLACQAEIVQPLLWLGALGKTAVVVLGVGLWLFDAVTTTMLSLLAGELLFAGYWFVWLTSSKAT